MKKADSPDPAKYLPALAASDHNGASGNIKFDEKGDRKDAEMTIFTLKDGKITPLAIIKGGKSMTLDEYAALSAPAPAAAPAQPAAMPRHARHGRNVGHGRHGTGRAPRCGSRCSAAAARPRLPRRQLPPRPSRPHPHPPSKRRARHNGEAANAPSPFFCPCGMRGR
jgi:hypothetical protein